jgi:hypothetical protein
VALVVLTVAFAPGRAEASAPETPNEWFVTRVYEDFLLRPPTADEYVWWNAVLGFQTRAQVANGILSSGSFTNLWVVGVHRYYLGAFDPSNPDVPGQVSSLQASLNFLETEVSVLASDDFFASAGGTNSGYVSGLYEKVLLRPADSSGLSYWTNRLVTGTSTRAQVARSLLRSTEAARRRVGGPVDMSTCSATTIEAIESLSAGSFCLVLDRMADPSGLTYWTGVLSGTGQLPTLWASHAGSTEYFNGAQP